MPRPYALGHPTPAHRPRCSDSHACVRQHAQHDANRQTPAKRQRGRSGGTTSKDSFFTKHSMALRHGAGRPAKRAVSAYGTPRKAKRYRPFRTANRAQVHNRLEVSRIRPRHRHPGTTARRVKHAYNRICKRLWHHATNQGNGGTQRPKRHRKHKNNAATPNSHSNLQG